MLLHHSLLRTKKKKRFSVVVTLLFIQADMQHKHKPLKKERKKNHKRKLCRNRDLKRGVTIY